MIGTMAAGAATGGMGADSSSASSENKISSTRGDINFSNHGTSVPPWAVGVALVAGMIGLLAYLSKKKG